MLGTVHNFSHLREKGREEKREKMSEPIVVSFIKMSGIGMVFGSGRGSDALVQKMSEPILVSSIKMSGIGMISGNGRGSNALVHTFRGRGVATTFSTTSSLRPKNTRHSSLLALLSACSRRKQNAKGVSCRVRRPPHKIRSFTLKVTAGHLVEGPPPPNPLLHGFSLHMCESERKR